MAAASIAFPSIIPARVLSENAPSMRTTLGFIGMGVQGRLYNMTSFLGETDAQIVAVCDTYLHRAKLAKAKVDETYGNQDCKLYQDFRYIINDPTIDAVVISTPDHWHVPMALMALEAGKDVFCEKPTQSINEGQILTNAFSKSDRIFQAGIEDRSLTHFHKMVEWVKNGAIGELERVVVHMPKGRNYPTEAPAPIPEDLDWNLWQGPAPFHEFTESRTKPTHWRQIGMYSKGTILDIGTHLIDTAQIAINDPDVCPIEVSGTGFIPKNRLTDVPTLYDLTYKYGNGVEMVMKNGEGLVWDPDSCYLEFQGSKGWIRRKTFNSGIDFSDKQIARLKYSSQESKHWAQPRNEKRDFLNWVKARSKQTTYPAIDLHDLCTTLHMGVMCIQLGRTLKWDTKKEKFIKDQEANRLSVLPDARDWEKES